MSEEIQELKKLRTQLLRLANLKVRPITRPSYVRSVANEFNQATAKACGLLGDRINSDNFRVNPELLLARALPKVTLGHVKSLASKLLGEINRAIYEAEIGKPTKGPAFDVDSLYDALRFHHRIRDVSESLFKTKHYAQAIFEAYKALCNYVKEKAELRHLDGRALMAKAFSEKKPVLKLNPLGTQSDKDEQEGFKFLFMGAMVGIRNPKAHDSATQNDPYRTLEYLSFASLLAKRAEEASKSL